MKGNTQSSAIALRFPFSFFSHHISSVLPHLCLFNQHLDIHAYMEFVIYI